MKSKHYGQKIQAGKKRRRADSTSPPRIVVERIDSMRTAKAATGAIYTKRACCRQKFFPSRRKRKGGERDNACENLDENPKFRAKVRPAPLRQSKAPFADFTIISPKISDPNANKRQSQRAQLLRTRQRGAILFAPINISRIKKTTS